MRTLTFFGWLLSWALLVGIAGPLVGTCTQGDDGPWVGGLIAFAPVGLLGLALAGIASPRGRRYRWLAAPHVVTALLGVYLIPTYFLQTTVHGRHVCEVRDGNSFDPAASFAQQLWAPAWLAILLVLAYVVFRYWRKPCPGQHG